MIPQDIIVPPSKIEGKKVLVVGAGGVGSWAAELLCRAGFHVGIIDPDTVEPRNMHRQLHFELNKSKVASLKREFCNQDLFDLPLTHENASQIISQFDYVLDCTDNMRTRYLIDEVCYNLGKPWVHTSAVGRKVQIMRVDPSDVCFSCVFKRMDDDSCDVFGVLGSTVVVAAGLGVNEIFNLVLGVKKSALYFFDLEDLEFQKVKLKPCAKCNHKSSFNVISLCGGGKFSSTIPSGTSLSYVREVMSDLGYVLKSESDVLHTYAKNGKIVSFFSSGKIIFSGFESKDDVQHLYNLIFKI